MDRRNFIKLTAVTGTSATLASCGNPEHQLIRFIPDEEHVPGIAEWKPSMCPLCQAGCGVLVKVMEGDAEIVRGGQTGLIKMGLAKKLEGNPAHPISQGALCARGQAAIQLTYHPDRLAQPLKRTGARGSAQFQPVSWDDAVGEVVAQLDRLAAAKNQRALMFLKRPARGQRDALVARFFAAFGALPPVAFEFFSDDVLRRANFLSFGHDQLPTFDLEHARFVISFGADFLGTWNSPVAQNAAYGRMRQGRTGLRGSFVQVEPRMSQTGASADEWIPVPPGTEGVLALGIAHVLIAKGLRPRDAAGHAGALVEGWSAGLSAYTPEEVERRTGVKAARVERLARDLAEQSPAVAIIGGAPLAQTNGLFSALAVNALNALLGTVNQPGGLRFMPQFASSAGPDTRRDESRSMSTIAAQILDGRQSPQVLMLDGANPVFASPPGWRVREALDKIPFIISFGSFIDETSALADLILPDHSFLESWVEGRPESGAGVAVATVAAPAVRPLHQTRAMPDVLLQVAEKLSPPVVLPWKTFDAMLMETVNALPAPSADSNNWSTAQKQGGIWASVGSAEPGVGVGPHAKEKATPRAVVNAAEFDGDPAEYPFHFLPYASQAFLDGSLAHLPWMQELPDVMATAMWSSWVEINPRAAGRLGIAQGDIVEVASRHGRVHAPALLSPGIAPDVIGMPVGQGHENFTRYASGRGSNPITVLAPLTEPETGALAWAATRVRISRVSAATGELILFAGGMRESQEERR